MVNEYTENITNVHGGIRVKNDLVTETNVCESDNRALFPYSNRIY